MGDHALEGEPEIARRLVAFLIQQGAVSLYEEQARDRRLARGSGCQGLPQPVQTLADARVCSLRLGDQLGGPAGGAPVQLVEQLLLAAKVAVDGAFGHTRFLGDLGRGGDVIACGREQLKGGTHQALARQIGLRHRAAI
jgi:hypothetical protein